MTMANYRCVAAQNAVGKGFNLVGYREEGFPFYNATIHMDGLTTCANLHTDEDGVAIGAPEEVYLNYINGPWSKGAQGVGSYGRHAENLGGNGGMLFMDKDHSLTTGSFTAFAVVCLNDQTQPGRGQFTVLRGCHHAMEKFYQMQQELGGIVGPGAPSNGRALALSLSPLTGRCCRQRAPAGRASTSTRRAAAASSTCRRSCATISSTRTRSRRRRASSGRKAPSASSTTATSS